MAEMEVTIGIIRAHVLIEPYVTERHVDLANKTDQIEDKGSASYGFYCT
jgi:hypothetical protein